MTIFQSDSIYKYIQYNAINYEYGWALTGSDVEAVGTSTSESRGLVSVTDVSEEVAASCPGNKNCGGSCMDKQKQVTMATSIDIC